MKEVSTHKANDFTEFMQKMEQVGFLILDKELFIKNELQCTSIPETFKGFISGHSLV
jgi:hypothetical protein